MKRGRVMGILAVSRAFGDYDCKAEGLREIGIDGDFVSCEPHVSETELCAEDDFVILACDGLWDVFSYQAAVNFVRTDLKNGCDVQGCAERLTHRAIKRGSMDNVSTIVVKFHQQL